MKVFCFHMINMIVLSFLMTWYLGERFLGDGDLFLGAGEAEAFLRGEGDSLGGA